MINNSGTITGGTFSCSLQGSGGTVENAQINGEIANGGTYETTCRYGESAYVNRWNFSGTIKLSVTANGKPTVINYGANVLKSLGTPPEGKFWALEAADGQITFVNANDTMPLLKNNETRNYVLIDPTTFIGNMSIDPIPDQTYTGKEITPAVTITNGDGKMLQANVDYTVEYKNNVNVGTATVTITGIVLYTGSVEKPFQITQAQAPEIIWPTTGSSIAYGQKLANSTLVSDEYGAFVWNEPATQPPLGTYYYNVTYQPKDAINYDYTGMTMTQPVSVTVTARDIKDPNIYIRGTFRYTYTGLAIVPQLDVMDGLFLQAEIVSDLYLTIGEDYTVATATTSTRARRQRPSPASATTLARAR